jgi:hypothetical protein
MASHSGKSRASWPVIHGVPIKKAVLECVRGGDLELYEDEIGRLYAFCLEDLEDDVVGGPRMVEANHAYVLFASRRGLDYDATEEDLGANATPEYGTTVSLVHATLNKETAKRVQITHRWLDAPARITIRIERVFRYKTRLSGKIEFALVDRK